MPQLDKSVTIFENEQVHDEWHQVWAEKERKIRSRLVRTCEALEHESKELLPLKEGDLEFIQNQGSNSYKPNK